MIGCLAYSEWEAKDGSKRSKLKVEGRVIFGGKDAAGDQVVAGEEGGGDE